MLCLREEMSFQARYYDDPGYIYHKEELEELYERRAEPETFV